MLLNEELYLPRCTLGGNYIFGIQVESSKASHNTKLNNIDLPILSIHPKKK